MVLVARSALLSSLKTGPPFPRTFALRGHAENRYYKNTRTIRTTTDPTTTRLSERSTSGTSPVSDRRDGPGSLGGRTWEVEKIWYYTV